MKAKNSKLVWIKNGVYSFVGLMLITGCSSLGANQPITPQYVSPNTYQTYDCATLTQEFNRVVAHIEQVNQQGRGLMASGVNIGIAGNNNGIYPTFSVNLATGANNRAEKQNKLATLYGEHDAILLAAKLKTCEFNSNIKPYGTQ